MTLTVHKSGSIGGLLEFSDTMKRFIVIVFVSTLVAFNCNEPMVNSPKIEKVFLDKSDTSKNHYTVFYPSEIPWSGFCVLIPGFGETAENVLQQTELPNKLALNGIMTIIPTFQDGVFSLGVDSLSQQTFDRILEDVSSKYDITKQKFYVGGFSIGGSCAIKYTENSTITPSAIFAIDPPLDFERFYYSAKRASRLSNANEANQENTYMINRLEKETGGSPSTHLTDYYKLSPYSFSDTTQSAIKKLINIPIRIYTEPDVNWWLKERHADLTDMNASECSAMINELRIFGNENATLIITEKRGYRKPDNIRHPHSWSIVDNEDLIEWLLKQK